jgi:hypothetical protein
MDINKTEYLKQKLEALKKRNSKPEEVDAEVAETSNANGFISIISFFTKATLIWLSLYMLNGKFPQYFVKFGYWETVLYFATLISIVTSFKSIKK